MSQLRQQPKRKTHFTAYAAVSMDGRISLDEKVMPDWLSPEDWKFFQNALSKVDAVVCGHSTYKAAYKHIDKRVAYVLTSTVKEPRIKGTVTFVNPKYTDLKVLLSKYKKVANVGGASAYQTMLDLGLFDDLYLTIEPVILGRGRELFAGGKGMTEFKLISSKKLNSRGTMVLHYELIK